MATYLDADFALALRATKYLEVNREAVVSRLLAEVPTRLERRRHLDLKVESALAYHVPVTDAHEPQLRAIVQCGNVVGGKAATKLLHLKGLALKSEMLHSLLERRDDYNYCSHLGRALQPFMQKEDLALIAEMADSIEHEMTDDDENSTTHGFVNGISEALAEVDLAEIAAVLLSEDNAQACSRARTQVLLECVQDRYSTEALQLAADLLLRGFKKAAVAIHFIGEHDCRERRLSWSAFGEQHVSRLVEMLGDIDDEPWALPALESICKARPDLAVVVAEHAHKAAGLRQAALFYALGAGHEDSVFSALEAVLTMNPAERKQEPEYLLSHLALNWHGHEDLFLRLLRVRNNHLAWCLLESVAVDPVEPQIGHLEIGDVAWWLDWLADTEDPATHWWFQDRLSRLFAQKPTPQTHKAFLAEFNRRDSKYRGILARTVLNARPDLTTDDLTEDALTFLLTDLSQNKECRFPGPFLGRTATEAFVTERLLPMVADAEEPLRSNLVLVLEHAGERHGRRYIPT